MITKEKLLYELINFSSVESPINTRDIFSKYHLRDETFLDYKRKISAMVRDLQHDQIYMSKISKPFYLIFSCNEGYYIAKNREEAIKGNEYYSNRAKSILALSNQLNDMINIAFPKNDQDQLDLLWGS